MRSFVALIVLTLFAGQSLAHELSTFRIPKHSVSSLSTSFNGNWSRDATVDDDSRDRYMYSSGALSLNGYWLYDSENLGLEFRPTVFVNGRLHGDASRAAEPGNRQTAESSYRAIDERYSVVHHGVFFPTKHPLGVNWYASGNALGAQSWGHGDSFFADSTGRYEGVSDSRGNQINYSTRGSVGLGWGRVRDASAVYDVYVLEDRLRELGRLAGELSLETRERLAALLYAKPDYNVRNTRSARFFWRDVEAILKDDPAMTGDLDAFALYRIGESVSPSSFRRLSGIRMTMNIAGVHGNNIQRDHYERFETFYTDSTAQTDTVSYEGYSRIRHSDQILFGPRIEVNVPLSWRWHFTGDTRIEHLIHPADDGYAWHTLFRARYAMHDRWLASYAFTLTRWDNHPKDRNQPRGQWSEIANSISLSYFVEDNIAVSGNLTFAQNTADEFFPNEPERGRYKRHMSETWAGVSMTYLLHGARTSSGRFFPRESSSVGDSWYPRYYSDFYDDNYYGY